MPLDGDAMGAKCRLLSGDRSPTSADQKALEQWQAEHCRRLSVYSVKIAAGTDHSGFAVRPLRSEEPIEYINFGAEGMYRVPKWDLSAAVYRPLHVASVSEISTLERQHTRAVGGVYFWLTNCCHHSTERELSRMGYGVAGARTTTRFDTTKVRDPPG